jgi:hypothetical protein
MSRWSSICRGEIHTRYWKVYLLRIYSIFNFSTCTLAELWSTSYVCTSGLQFLVSQYKQETLGVPVVTYGETQDFPAFYSPSSGFKVGLRFARVNSTMHSISSDSESMAGE